VVFAVLDDEAGRSSSRLPHVLRAFASTVSRMPTARLLLAGPREWDPPIPSDVRSAVVRLDARSEEARRRAVGAADVCLDLHWPRAAGPTDGWLAAIAAGKPPVFVDAGAMTDVPALDPRSWRPADRRPPIGVALDILDEDHSLRLAVYRLAIDRGLRERLGRAAQSYWRQHHTLDRMTTDMTMAIEQAVAADEPSRPV
jgi:hypothetical protein